jgi:hypothetical protein
MVEFEDGRGKGFNVIITEIKLIQIDEGVKDVEIKSLYWVVLKIDRTNVGGIREACIRELQNIIFTQQHLLEGGKIYKHSIYVMNVIVTQVNDSQLLISLENLRIYLDNVIVAHVELL